MRRSRILPGVLALLFALQWGTAFARCVAAHTAQHGTIELCTTEGIVHMPWPGIAGAAGAGDALPAGQAAPFACPVCAALPALDAPPAPTAYAAISFAPLAYAAPATRAPPVAPACHPGQPRAPPAA